MNTADLIEFWGRVPAQAPFLHPADADVLRSACIDLEAYGIYPSLYPQPWVGPITTAQAFLLQLNPGFSGLEVQIEETSSEFRTAIRENLNGDRPNLFLDPRFKDHPGRRWVESHLRDVAPVAELSTKVAQVELFPYHSKKFSLPSKVRRVLLDLPSVKLIRSWVRNVLQPAAVRNDVAIVVQRSTAQWGFTRNDESQSVVVYEGGECQGGWITSRTRGGQMLMRHLSV